MEQWRRCPLSRPGHSSGLGTNSPSGKAATNHTHPRNQSSSQLYTRPAWSAPIHMTARNKGYGKGEEHLVSRGARLAVRRRAQLRQHPSYPEMGPSLVSFCGGKVNERSFSLLASPAIPRRARSPWTGWTGRSHQASERLVQPNTVAGRSSLARHALLLNPQCWHALRAIASLARSTAPAAAGAEHGPARAAGRWRMSRLMPG